MEQPLQMLACRIGVVQVYVRRTRAGLLHIDSGLRLDSEQH
jgi:hypothetical protein